MERPSGDQAMASGADSRVAMRLVAPVSIQRTNNCGEPPSEVET